MAPRSAEPRHFDDRPSSSSGTRTVEFKRTDFDKRKSRDDLYLMTMTAEKQQQKFKSFHTPNRNRFLSVDSGGSKEQQESSQQHQQQQHHSRSQRPKFGVAPLQQHPPYVSEPSPGTDNEGSETAGIGMALGSPAHPPAGAWATTAWQPQLKANSQQPTTSSPLGHSASPEAPWTPDEPSLKPKSRKWGLFSRSKSKKGRNPTESRDTNSPQPQQYLQKPPPSQSRQQQPTNTSHRSQTDSPADGARPSARRQGSADSQAESSTGSKPRYKPIVIPYEIPTPSPKGSAKIKASLQPMRSPHAGLAPVGGARSNAAPAVSLLDVHIPDITMERYSIMFGQVLKRPPGQQAQDTAAATRQISRELPMRPPPSSSSSSISSSSSLLARRQATLGRLKTIEDEMLHQEPEPHQLEAPRVRRASASTKQSPALYLFPPSSTPSGGKPLSPRSRSFTSPAGMPLPTRPAPEPPVQRVEPSRAQTFPSIGKNAGLTDNTMSSSPQGRPRLASKFQRRDSQSDIKRVGPLVDSPNSMSMGESSPEFVRREPARDIVTPPASSTGSRTSTPKKDSVSSITSENASFSKSVEDPTDDKTLRDAVQASITRQISVSREQRELLRPFRSHSRRKVKPLGAGKIAIGENERIAETKKSTPTLVHPDPNAFSPQSHNMYRKSSEVVFDAA